MLCSSWVSLVRSIRSGLEDSLVWRAASEAVVTAVPLLSLVFSVCSLSSLVRSLSVKWVSCGVPIRKCQDESRVARPRPSVPSAKTPALLFRFCWLSGVSFWALKAAA